MKYIKNYSTNPYYNLAFEEYVHRNFKHGDFLLLWVNHNTIVIGKNQNTLEEIDPQGVARLGVQVVRRNTGGGAVYHDNGNLNFSFITDWAIDGDHSFSRFAMPVIAALKAFGIEAVASGRNDILIDGKKFSGNAQYVFAGRILHHGTLLVNSDLSVMPQVLRVKPEKIQSKGVKSVRSRVTNIQDCTETPVDVETLKAALLQACSLHGPVEEITLTPEQLAEIEKLAKEKYETKEWNYGVSPVSTFSNTRRFPGGELTVNLDVKGDLIRSCHFSGDFLSLRDTEEVAARFAGIPWELEKVKKALAQIPVELYFGSITTEEILHLFFPGQV